MAFGGVVERKREIVQLRGGEIIQRIAAIGDVALERKAYVHKPHSGEFKAPSVNIHGKHAVRRIIG